VKLVVGLGNPGKKFELTRHNIGFLVIDYLSDEMKIPLNKKEFNALVGKRNFKNQMIILAKPDTYMNQSGVAVEGLFKYYRPDLKDIIIIHDDMDIELGRLKIKVGGGSAGHKGIASIISELGAPDFTRVKIGIGRPPNGVDGADFVLSIFSSEEFSLVKEIVPLASKAVLTIINQGIERAMTQFN